jgi:hypothetical protein
VRVAAAAAGRAAGRRQAHTPPFPCSIFYPDLLDNQVAPTYKIVKDKVEPEIATIIFSAGPPYEDIAFKIVNKEWEHSHKRGFRSSFDRGVLQLYFNFRRNFYRSASLAGGVPSGPDCADHPPLRLSQSNRPSSLSYRRDRCRRGRRRLWLWHATVDPDSLASE